MSFQKRLWIFAAAFAAALLVLPSAPDSPHPFLPEAFAEPSDPCFVQEQNLIRVKRDSSEEAGVEHILKQCRKKEKIRRSDLEKKIKEEEEARTRIESGRHGARGGLGRARADAKRQAAAAAEEDFNKMEGVCADFIQKAPHYIGSIENRGVNLDGDDDEGSGGAIKSRCLKHQKEGETCCYNPDKCAPVAKQALKIAAPLASAFAIQIGSIKAATGKWDPYKYCQFNNIRGLMETGSNSAVAMLDLMERGCGYGEKQCEKNCGREVEKFKGEAEKCFGVIAALFGLDSGIGSVLRKLGDETGDDEEMKKNPPNREGLSAAQQEAYKTARNKKWDESPIPGQLRDVGKAYREESKGDRMRDNMKASDFVSCGEANRKFSHMRRTGNPALLRPFMMSFCQKMGEITPPDKPSARRPPGSPAATGGPGGAPSSADMTGDEDNRGTVSIPQGPGAATQVPEDDFPSEDKDKPGEVKASGFGYPGTGGGPGGGPGGGLPGGDFGGGEDDEGEEEEEEEEEGYGSGPGYGIPESFEGGGDFAGGDSYIGGAGGGLGPGGGGGYTRDGGGDKDGDKDGEGLDMKKYIPQHLDPDMSIFQMMSQRIQEYCREKIKEGCR